MKKVLLSIAIVLVVVGATYAVTRAFFTDTETSTGSQFTVGTLDLEVGGANGSNVEPFVVTGIGQSGNNSGSKTWTVNNTGTLPGRLYLRLEDTINYENGCNEPEALADVTCANPGAQEGEVGDKIIANVYLGGSLVSSHALTSTTQADFNNEWRLLAPVIIEAGENVDIKIDWSFDQDDYGNEVQSDSLEFDVGFDLEQLAQS